MKCEMYVNLSVILNFCTIAICVIAELQALSHTYGIHMFMMSSYQISHAHLQWLVAMIKPKA
jgi:hypothetical protein